MNRPISGPRRCVLARAIGLLFAGSFPLLGQAQGSAAPAPATRTLDTVVITGNPLGSAQIAAPVSVLSGDGLVLRRGSSLGETLDGLPGVSATYFGPTPSSSSRRNSTAIGCASSAMPVRRWTRRR